MKFFSKDSKEKEKEIKEKDFNTSDFKDLTAEEPVKLLADCRLLRKDELQVIKSSLNPRAPDCFQRTPRRVNIVEGSNDSLLTISTDGQGKKALNTYLRVSDVYVQYEIVLRYFYFNMCVCVCVCVGVYY